jgi:hypothetical protein
MEALSIPPSRNKKPHLTPDPSPIERGAMKNINYLC